MFSSVYCVGQLYISVFYSHFYGPFSVSISLCKFDMVLELQIVISETFRVFNHLHFRVLNCFVSDIPLHFMVSELIMFQVSQIPFQISQILSQSSSIDLYCRVCSVSPISFSVYSSQHSLIVTTIFALPSGAVLEKIFHGFIGFLLGFLFISKDRQHLIYS